MTHFIKVNLFLMKILPIKVTSISRKIQDIKIEQDPRFAVTMVAVSGGYPGDFLKGYEIEGLDQPLTDAMIFHAGTKEEDGKIVSNGGRVLTVTSFGENVDTCVDRSKAILSGIKYRNMYFRNDIGYEFMNAN